jgi:hypothetical protein
MKWAAGGLSIPQRPLSATAVAASRGQHDSTANHLRGFQMRWGRRSGARHGRAAPRRTATSPAVAADLIQHPGARAVSIKKDTE